MERDFVALTRERPELARRRALCERVAVRLSRIELRFRDAAGAPHVLALVFADTEASGSASLAGASIAARIERGPEGTFVRTNVVNRDGAPISLDSAVFRLATGLAPDSRAFFLKHGYQSWSPCGPVAVGVSADHPRDRMPRIVRLIHQSEASRPSEAPEAATSELFTIVECGEERILAGFVGGAGQLTTVTVTTPSEITARALFDGVPLAPGAERQIEPLLFLRGRQSAAELASRWAGILGRSMRARASAPYQRGWCSWYHYFHDVSEASMRANIAALARMREEFPLDVIQLDDGYQAALGDWTSTNSRFPSGLKRLADEIRSAGFTPGIWTAPFLAARDSRVMTDHPDWFIRHSNGEPLRAAHNANWTKHHDAFAYALDPSNPAVAEHLRRTFSVLAHDFGYSYLKLDFLYAAAAEGIRHDLSLTRAETIRRGLEAIRAGAGESAFLLGCGCPLGPAVGVVDGMRIGPDVAPYWKTTDVPVGAPSTADAIEAIVSRSFMHRRLWLNDPDCLMLCRQQTQLSDDEQDALASVVAASGGMLLISDDMSLLGAEQGRLFRAVAKLGEEVDRESRLQPALADDLMAAGPLRRLSKSLPDGRLLLILNPGDSPQRIELSDLGIARARAYLVTLGGEEQRVAGAIEIPPHGARLILERS